MTKNRSIIAWLFSASHARVLARQSKPPTLITIIGLNDKDISSPQTNNRIHDGNARQVAWQLHEQSTKYFILNTAVSTWMHWSHFMCWVSLLFSLGNNELSNLLICANTQTTDFVLELDIKCWGRIFLWVLCDFQQSNCTHTLSINPTNVVQNGLRVMTDKLRVNKQLVFLIQSIWMSK